MIFAYKNLDSEERGVLAKIAEMRHQLRHNIVSQPRRWTGLLARMTRARALRASNSIEGINVSAEDAIAAIDEEDPTTTDKQTWKAAVGYNNAMGLILQRCQDEKFKFSKELILALHYMICQSDLNANPGNFRPGWVGVRNSLTGDVVHEGVNRDLLEPLVDELIDSMNFEDVEAVEVKAALAHLNLAMLHPFSDGNGRVARCLQTAVLATEGIVAPIFSSIEEYIGFNQQKYYDVLSEVGKGSWNPHHNCKPWIRFCITGHFHQARTYLRRISEFERVYGDLQALTEKEGFMSRFILALMEAAFKPQKVRNASYRVSANISMGTASRDLKSLVDAGFLRSLGESKGRFYVPTQKIIDIREKHRLPKNHVDPFEDLEIISGQKTLFEKQ